MLAALNNKLRRRNSSGSPSTTTGAALPTMNALVPGGVQPKIGPQRSTKNAQKLKLLPNPEVGEDGPDEESGRDVYSQYTRIKDPTARRDAARLGKADRDTLPRVTAYCTANKYQMEGLMRFLKGRGKTRGANPKLIDECIYSPYSYGSKKQTDGQQRQSEVQVPRPAPMTAYDRRHSTGQVGEGGSYHRDDLMDLRTENRPLDLDNDGYAGRTDDSAIADDIVDFDVQVHTPEVFLFDYGVVVIWGMTLVQEQKFLKEIAKFETEKLAADDVETEFFNFYYTREYQARIYNDFITLRDKTSYMTKLAISHALAQSVKVQSLRSISPPLCSLVTDIGCRRRCLKSSSH
jgi:uncharacterized Rmd1/YagE family protein